MKKIMVVFGTRPEAIKMSPLVLELKSRKNVDIKVCLTGQHKEMLDQVLDVFNIQADYNLSIMKPNQDLFDITTAILDKIKNLLDLEKPDLVLVHGDTSTTFVTSLACYYMQIPIGHVEAGLRTDNIYSPFPEEFNRRAVGLIANYNFAPTIRAQNNLLKEGKKASTIFVTGNTVIDSLKTTINKDFTHSHLKWAENSRLILVTAHRRENLGQPMENIFKAIRRLIEDHSDVKVIYPVHMNPKVKILAQKILGDNDRVRLIEPLDVIDFHNFIAASYLVLTDSGGIQEEAPSLGKPVLVLRDTTERPEGVEVGTLKLVGTEENKIYDSTSLLLNNKDEYNKMSKASNPFGDGLASKRIVDIILKN